jgi:hypothetical protein
MVVIKGTLVDLLLETIMLLWLSKMVLFGQWKSVAAHCRILVAIFLRLQSIVGSCNLN